MFRSRERRIRRMNRDPNDPPAPRVRRVHEDELFRQMGFRPETVH